MIFTFSAFGCVWCTVFRTSLDKHLNIQLKHIIFGMFKTFGGSVVAPMSLLGLRSITTKLKWANACFCLLQGMMQSLEVVQEEAHSGCIGNTPLVLDIPYTGYSNLQGPMACIDAVMITKDALALCTRSRLIKAPIILISMSSIIFQSRSQNKGKY